MERFIRGNFWLLSGVLILIAAPVAASTLQRLTDFKLTELIPGLGTKSARTDGESIVIERERIIIPAGVHQRYADAAGPGSAGTAQAPAQPAVADNPRPPPGSGIRAVGEHAYEVPSEDVRDAFSRLEEQAMQVRLVPAFRDGQPRGFKLFSIKPDSIYAKLGLQNGDIIQRVNGLSLQTPQSAMAAFESLREARHVELNIERDGTVLHKVYDVR